MEPSGFSIVINNCSVDYNTKVLFCQLFLDQVTVKVLEIINVLLDQVLNEIRLVQAIVIT